LPRLAPTWWGVIWGRGSEEETGGRVVSFQLSVVSFKKKKRKKREKRKEKTRDKREEKRTPRPRHTLRAWGTRTHPGHPHPHPPLKFSVMSCKFKRKRNPIAAH
jgi:hypothetical protein